MMYKGRIATTTTTGSRRMINQQIYYFEFWMAGEYVFVQTDVNIIVSNTK